MLAQIGAPVAALRPAEIDETPLKAELPRPYCQRMARQKAAALRPDLAAGEVVLCADTTVSVGRRILGKPADQAEAETMLRLLSGRRHRVITAMAVASPTQLWQRDVVTQVRFKRLSDAEIAWYLASGDWQGKAGGYAIQGPASVFVPWISGSYSAVMGLPLYETGQILRQAGIVLEPTP